MNLVMVLNWWLLLVITISMVIDQGAMVPMKDLWKNLVVADNGGDMIYSNGSLVIGKNKWCKNKIIILQSNIEGVCGAQHIVKLVVFFLRWYKFHSEHDQGI